MVESPPRRRTAMWASIAVGVLVALLVAVLATRDPSTERRTSSPLVGRLAPPVAGETLDGEAFDMDALRGRWVVVNFFATWCTPCIVEHPELVTFDEAHRSEGDAAIVSVIYDDDPEEARSFFAERGGEWPVLVDPDNAIGVAYGVARVPESFVVAPNGTVVAKVTSGVTAAELDALIAQFEEAA